MQFVYDRHGRRHRIVKKSANGISPQTNHDSVMAALHLESAYKLLEDAGKRLKADPRPKLKEWAKTGIGRQEFAAALDFIGVTKLPEEGAEALWQEMREGESFNKEVSQLLGRG